MNIFSLNQLYVLLPVLILVAAVIVLQVFLSKREDRWPGLILPLVGLLYALYNIINTLIILPHVPGRVAIIYILTSLLPAAILFAVYALCRKLQTRKSALEKMRLQDLE